MVRLLLCLLLAGCAVGPTPKDATAWLEFGSAGTCSGTLMLGLVIVLGAIALGLATLRVLLPLCGLELRWPPDSLD